MALENEKALLKGAYEAWAKSKGSDQAAWLDLMAPEVELFTLAGGAAGLPENGTVTTREGMVGYLNAVTDGMAMEFMTVETMVAEGDTVFALLNTSWTNKATGKPFRSPVVTRWRFRDGKIVAYAEYYDTAAIIAAASPD